MVKLESCRGRRIGTLSLCFASVCMNTMPMMLLRKRLLSAPAGTCVIFFLPIIVASVIFHLSSDFGHLIFFYILR